MNSNSLPFRFTTAYRIIRFIKNKPKIYFEDVQENFGECVIRRINISNIKAFENERINQLFRDLEPYSKYVQVFLHGSYADNTLTPFSDIDDFVVLDIDVLQEENKLSNVIKILNRIDMKFCRIDPIQHHGHWLCSKEDLKNYDNSFMPLEVIKHAKNVIGENTMSGIINTKISKIGLKKNILNTCDGIKRLSELYFNNKINAYQLKGLVGSFVLMPAFIFQVKGESCTKPEAILRANTIFSEKSISCIQWSTNNRNNWKYITQNRKFEIFSTLSYICFDPHLWRRFSSNFSPKVSENQKTQLSNIALTRESVTKFITESLEYAK